MKVLLTATVQSHICQFHKPLVEVLHEHGCEVHVAAKDNLAEKNGLKLDFVDKVYNVPFARSPKSKDNLKAYKELKKIIEQEHYDVVHCNTPMGGIVTRLAARKVRKTGTKVYYTAHGFHFYKGAPKKNWIVFYPIEKYFSRLTDKLITITHEDYELAKQKFHCEVSRIHGVGVDGNRYYAVSKEENNQIRKIFGYSQEQKIILCAGELLPNKNQKMIISAMRGIVKQYADVELLLAGNGPEKENLEELIANYHLENNVEMLGYVTNLQEYQKIADICVTCSRREGLPLNVVEAMLAETPVVATRNRGHRELLCDGETGFLIDVGDDITMGKRVLELLSNEKTYERIQLNAKKYAKAYTFDHVKKELMKVYGIKNE